MESGDFLNLFRIMILVATTTSFLSQDEYDLFSQLIVSNNGSISTAEKLSNSMSFSAKAVTFSPSSPPSKRQVVAKDEEKVQRLEAKRRKTTCTVQAPGEAQLTVVKHYIKFHYGRDINEKHPSTQRTPFDDAVRGEPMRNDTTAIFLLLEVVPKCYNSSAIIDVNATNNIKCTSALTTATGVGNYEVAKLLIENGADINQVNEDKQSPLHFACGYNVDRAFRREDSYLYSPPNLVWDAEFVKYLIEHGANVEATDCKGNTPLLVACTKDHNDIVMFLLQEGAANIECASKDGETPLYLCVRRDNDYTAEILIEKGADIGRIRRHGRSLL